MGTPAKILLCSPRQSGGVVVREGAAVGCGRDFWGVVAPVSWEGTMVLASAAEAGLDNAVVIGFTEGGEFFFASSVADGGTVLWLMALAKKRLLEVAEKF